MIEKEKAKELIVKFYRYAKGQTNEARLINAKCSALFCVDEIIKAHPHKIIERDGFELVPCTFDWCDVKTEIENYEL